MDVNHINLLVLLVTFDRLVVQKMQGEWVSAYICVLNVWVTFYSDLHVHSLTLWVQLLISQST